MLVEEAWRVKKRVIHYKVMTMMKRRRRLMSMRNVLIR